MKVRIPSTIALIVMLFIASAAQADVKTEERTRVELGGPMGGLLKTFGGKGAREGVLSQVSVKGDRKMTVTGDTAQLIDLAEGKIYQIDMKKKSYTVLTFEEMRRQMEEAIAKAKASAGSAKAEEQKGQKPEFAVDFKLAESGQKKTIAGYETREVVATITVREKNKKAEDGSMMLTSSMWLAPRIAALKELEDFDVRFAQKLALKSSADAAAEMATMMSMYPGLGDAMGKLEVEKVKMNGTAVLTVTRAEAVGNPNEPAQAAKPAEPAKPQAPTSIGGLLGGFGRKAVKKDDNAADDAKPAALMTTNHEVLSVSTTVAAADVAIPAGFKEKK